MICDISVCQQTTKRPLCLPLRPLWLTTWYLEAGWPDWQNFSIVVLSFNFGEFILNWGYFLSKIKFPHQIWRQMGDFLRPHCHPKIWSRCYDHNFLRFLPIFGEKIGVFLKNQCYNHFFKKIGLVLSQKRQFFRKIFLQKYF
jgi:hypothetical protein